MTIPRQFADKKKLLLSHLVRFRRFFHADLFTREISFPSHEIKTSVTASICSLEITRLPIGRWRVEGYRHVNQESFTWKNIIERERGSEEGRSRTPAKGLGGVKGKELYTQHVEIRRALSPSSSSSSAVVVGRVPSQSIQRHFRATWACFCRTCGFGGLAPRHATLRHAVSFSCATAGIKRNTPITLHPARDQDKRRADVDGKG